MKHEKKWGQTDNTQTTHTQQTDTPHPPMENYSPGKSDLTSIDAPAQHTQLILSCIQTYCKCCCVNDDSCHSSFPFLFADPTSTFHLERKFGFLGGFKELG